MATIMESMQADAAANGFDAGAVSDKSTNDRAQRAYLALKLFQIEQNTKRVALATEAAAKAMR